MEILENIEMKPYSYMEIGGKAKELIFIDNKEELTDIVPNKKNFFLIGNGTNTLINDEYLDMTFISLKKLKDISVEQTEKDYDLVRIEAGLDFDELIDFMEESDYTGLENIAGVPGSVGGLVNMNGGAYGTEIFDCIEEVEICDLEGNIKKYKKNELEFQYRTTQIKKNKWIVISVLFRFYRGFDKVCVEGKKGQREQKHPLELPSLGSTFKNPEGHFAAMLISDAGLKEFRIGNIMVSPKHPNFVVNLGDGKFLDVIAVVEHVKNKVLEKFNIQLETEIIILR